MELEIRIPTNGKIFLIDAPGISSTALNALGNGTSGMVVESKQDLRENVLINGNQTSDILPWHSHVTLTWNAILNKWDPIFDAGTGYILP